MAIKVNYSRTRTQKYALLALEHAKDEELKRLDIARSRARVAKAVMVETAWGSMRPLVRITSDIRARR